jgi:hypothetical protein
MERVKVVVHDVDHRILKGYTQDFFPNKHLFHLYPLVPTGVKENVEIFVKDLKAVFFVKDFQGDAGYQEKKEFPETGQQQGRRVSVTFFDGEIMLGNTLGYDPDRLGFFLFPVDPLSNNMRVFCVSKAVKDVRYL